MHGGSKVTHAAVVSDVRGGSYFDGLAAMLDDLDSAGRAASRPVPRGRRADTADALQGDAPPAPADAARQRRRGNRPRTRAAGAAARTRRRRDRHERSDRRDAAAQARRRAAADPHPGTAGGHVRELRLQVRPEPRRGPDVRRPLPAQPALRARAAAADRAATTSVVEFINATASSIGSTSICTRCSIICCRSTWPRARRTSWSRSDARAAGTARWRSPSIWRARYDDASGYLVEVVHRDVTRPRVIDHIGFEVADLDRIDAVLRRRVLRARRAADARLRARGRLRHQRSPVVWFVVRGRARRRRATATSRCRRAARRRSMPPTQPVWPTAAATTARRASARSTAGATTRPTCSTPTGCGSRWCPGADRRGVGFDADPGFKQRLGSLSRAGADAARAPAI